MSQVITCPHCEKKLALKDELQGRDLICPQCRSRFAAPAGEQQPAADAFFDNLASAAGPVTATTKTSASGRSGAAMRSTATQAEARTMTGRAKKKKDQMMLVYIGGGIAAVVVVFILIALAMPHKDVTGSGGNKNMRFGMTESQRKRFFGELFHAVDELGPNKECRDEWRQLGSKWNLSDQQISEIRKEGMDRGWEQPAIPATTDQKQKTNRREWIRIMTQTHRDPILSQ